MIHFCSGANIATGVVLRILENRQSRPTSSSASAAAIPPLPVALVFAYAALSFHFTSWMSSSDLRVLRSDSHPDIASLLRQKDHLDHRSPLAVVEDVEKRSSGSERGRPKVLRRRRTTSWGRGLVRGLPGSASFAALREGYFASGKKAASSDQVDRAAADEREDADEEEVPVTDETEKSLSERVVWWDDQAFAGGEQVQKALGDKVRAEEAGVVKRDKGKQVAEGEEAVLSETRLAMTSRTAFFNGACARLTACRSPADVVRLDQTASSRRPWCVTSPPFESPRTRLMRSFTVPCHGPSIHRASQRARPALRLPHLAHLYAARSPRPIPARLPVLRRARSVR